MQKQQVKTETSLAKVIRKPGLSNGRLKATEPSARGRAQDIADAPLVCIPSDGQWRREIQTGDRTRLTAFIPVISQSGKALMPTTPGRARRWAKCRKGTFFFRKGLLCVRLNVETEKNTQDIAIGIDPGSKREGFTVKSEAHTYINIQAKAIDWVKSAVESRRNARRARRQRNTPCRQLRSNRKSLRNKGLPPSTLARWNSKLRIVKWLCSMFPVEAIVVEDIKAKTLRNARKWNRSFSPLEVGKKWFYAELQNLTDQLVVLPGYETRKMRQALGLHKTSNKLSNSFDAHCVDSWVLANSFCISGKPDNTVVHVLEPMRWHRRQLHVFQPAQGNNRKQYGGTHSLGITRGCLAKHKKYGLCYVGGTMDSRLSLHDRYGKRLCQNACISDVKIISLYKWRFFLPRLKAREFPKSPKRN